jgi:hypothetical protein
MVVSKHILANLHLAKLTPLIEKLLYAMNTRALTKCYFTLSNQGFDTCKHLSY